MKMGFSGVVNYVLVQVQISANLSLGFKPHQGCIPVLHGGAVTAANQCLSYTANQSTPPIPIISFELKPSVHVDRGAGSWLIQ